MRRPVVKSGSGNTHHFLCKWAQEKLIYHEETFKRTRPGEGQPCVVSGWPVSEIEERKKETIERKYYYGS